MVLIVSLLSSFLTVSSEATWLQALGYSVNYDGAPDMFCNGELRAIGLIF